MIQIQRNHLWVQAPRNEIATVSCLLEQMARTWRHGKTVEDIE